MYNFLISIAVFSSLTIYTKADMCRGNFTMDELPHGLLNEIVNFVTTGSFLGCPDTIRINPDNVRLWLFTRGNRDVPILLDTKNGDLNKTKPIKMLIPGWLCNITGFGFLQLKNAYLDAFDYNVISVEWTKYAVDYYAKSFCYIPQIAKVIARFFCNIHKENEVDLKTVHVIGHSLGGQMAGMIGQEVQKQCQNRLGRITGLDPAGPLYQNIHQDRRLDESDARFVDVIHTNQKIFGYYGKAGKVDFYPNCGTFQPGCKKIDRETSISKLLNLSLGVVMCNHGRSLQYLLESISSDRFTSTSCRTCPGLSFLGVCMKDDLNSTFTKMGEYAIRDPPFHKFYLATNSHAPFGQG